ncbi:uncharacterized protein LOC142224900 [Haematobia irritans]|uniref:uncharacterized protein LOC142224900 n=1 Tax=Haematobia irritans TaxID=7368 RepID=UPI003F5003EA
MRPQPLETKPGLYFEGIGTARIATAEWKLMVYYNLIPFRSEIDNFADGIKTFSDLCKMSPHEAICNNFASHLKQTRADLIQDRDIIMPRRLRRGALNIVGNVARSLFGILDADYAAEMDNTIQRAETDRSHLTSLLHNQTSIIDSTLNIIKEDELSLKTRIYEVQTTISTIHNQVVEDKAQQRIAHTVALLANELTLAAARLRQVEAEIVNVLTDSHHGRISPSLLTPDQLQREINVIKAHLPISRVLHFDDIDLIQFYKIMRTKAAVTKDKVMFEIRLPLVGQQTFELLKIFAVPANENDTLVTIHPQKEYLAINLHRDEYMPLSSDDIRTCIQPSSDIFICDNNHAMFSKGSMAASCEVDMFRHKPTNRCKVNIYKEPIIWQQLHYKNQWIYATTCEIDVSTVCGTKTLQYTLQGSGIINLEPICTLKTSEVTLRGHYNASSFIQASYSCFPKFNLTTHEREPAAILNSTDQLLINHTEQLTDLQNKLREADISNLRTTYRSDRHHHMAISYTALIMSSMLLMFYLGWRFLNRGGESIQPPTPQPRQTVPDSCTAQLLRCYIIKHIYLNIICIVSSRSQ